MKIDLLLSTAHEPSHPSEKNVAHFFLHISYLSSQIMKLSVEVAVVVVGGSSSRVVKALRFVCFF